MESYVFVYLNESVTKVKNNMMMDKKLPFRSQLADLLLSDMICLTIKSLLLTGSTGITAAPQI